MAGAREPTWSSPSGNWDPGPLSQSAEAQLQASHELNVLHKPCRQSTHGQHVLAIRSSKSRGLRIAVLLTGHAAGNKVMTDPGAQLRFHGERTVEKAAGI
jgi:hypothetical protein